MSEIKGLLGNKKNIQHFRDAARMGRLSHAYIINGAKGSGKKTFARYVAEMLLCEDAQCGAPCGKCASCIKALSGNHPDIIHVEHEKASVLGIDEVRDQVIYDLATAPYYGPYKIYIIKDANLLNENGQNALLKTIEEPPEYALLFLLTDNAEGFLETISSRCTRLDMELLDSKTIEDALVGAGVPKIKANEAARFSNGNLGEALELAGDGEYAIIKEQIIKSLKKIENLDAYEILEIASGYDKKEKQAALDYEKALKVMLIWYRDVLKTKAGAEGIYNINDRAVIVRQAEKLSFESINKIIDAIEDADVKIKASVKKEAALEEAYLKIREAYK